MADQPRHEPLEASGFFRDGRSARQLVPGTIARGYLRDDPILFTGRAGTSQAAPSDQGAAPTDTGGQTGREGAGDVGATEDAPTGQAGRQGQVGQEQTTEGGQERGSIIPGGGEQGQQPGQQQAGQEGEAPAELFPFPITLEVLELGRERYNIYCAVCHDRVGTGQGVIVQRGFSRPPSLHIERLREAPVGHYFDVITNGWGAMPNYGYMIPVRDRWAIIAYIRALQLSQNATIEDVPPEQRDQLASEEQRP